MIPIGSLCVVIPPGADEDVGAFTTVVGHAPVGTFALFLDGQIAPIAELANLVDLPRRAGGIPIGYTDKCLRVIRPPRNAQPAPPVRKDEPVTA